MVDTVAAHSTYLAALRRLEAQDAGYGPSADEQERWLDEGRQRLDEVRAAQEGRVPELSRRLARRWADWTRENAAKREREARYSVDHQYSVRKPPEEGEAVLPRIATDLERRIRGRRR